MKNNIHKQGSRQQRESEKNFQWDKVLKLRIILKFLCVCGSQISHEPKLRVKTFPHGEIEALKQENKNLSQKHQATQKRLKDQIQTLEKDNSSLKDRIVKLENEKLVLKASLNKFTHRQKDKNPIDEINKLVNFDLPIQKSRTKSEPSPKKHESAPTLNLNPGFETKTEIQVTSTPFKLNDEPYVTRLQ